MAPDNDAVFMARALELAERGRGFVTPNPRVGAVLARDGQIVAEGWHKVFGGPHAEVECLRALLYRATEMYVGGQDVHELATMCKLKSGRMSRQVSDTCLQFWGGMGFTWDNRVSRFYRDGRLGSIGGGADEVMLGILAKLMGMAKTKRD